MIQALKDNLIIKPLYEEKKNSILIPQTAINYKRNKGNVLGLVISIGKDYKHKDLLNPGDRISYQRGEGIKFIYQGETYLKLKARWVMGKVN